MMMTMRMMTRTDLYNRDYNHDEADSFDDSAACYDV